MMLRSAVLLTCVATLVLSSALAVESSNTLLKKRHQSSLEVRHDSSAQAGNIFREIKYGLEQTGHGIKKWFKKNKCEICEDGAKVIGIGIQALIDAYGEGEAESAAVIAFRATLKKIVKGKVIGKIEAEFCDIKLAKPVAEIVHLFDDSLKTKSLEKCITEICTGTITAVLKSGGQLLLAEFLPVLAAGICECPLPYQSCVDFVEGGKKPPLAVPSHPSPYDQGILDEMKALDKALDIIGKHNDKAKAALLALDEKSHSSNACLIDEFQTKKMAFGPKGKQVWHTWGHKKCISDLDCQGQRKCTKMYSSGPIGECYGYAGPECCPKPFMKNYFNKEAGLSDATVTAPTTLFHRAKSEGAGLPRYPGVKYTYQCSAEEDPNNVGGIIQRTYPCPSCRPRPIKLPTTMTTTPKPGSTPAVCPPGWEQVNKIGADVPGCGLEGCNARYGSQAFSPAACAEHCLKANSLCYGFTWAPLDGDKSHPGRRVCTIYSNIWPVKTWAGVNGEYMQVLCKMGPGVRTTTTTTLKPGTRCKPWDTDCRKKYGMKRRPLN